MKHKFMKIFRSNDTITTSFYFYHKKYAVKKRILFLKTLVVIHNNTSRLSINRKVWVHIIKSTMEKYKKNKYPNFGTVVAYYPK